MLAVNSLLAMFRENPLRTFLTLLQLALGVALAIVIINLGLSFDKMVNDSNNFFGDTFGKYTVSSMALSPSSVPPSSFSMQISSKKFNAPQLLADDPSIEAITQVWNIRKILIANGQVFVATTFRGYHTFPEVIPVKMLHGSFFSKEEEKGHYMVISESFAKEMFGKTNVVGQTLIMRDYYPLSLMIRMGNQPETEFTIVGVFEDLPYIMRYTIDKIHAVHTLELGQENKYTPESIYIRSKTGRLSEAERALLQTTQAFYGSQASLRPEDMNAKTTIALQGLTTLKSNLSFIALAAIIVSSVGILSVMIASINEKSKSIGIKRALGATKLNIFTEVLWEALILTLFGALLGIVLAYLIAPLLYHEMVGSIRDLSRFQSTDFTLLPYSIALSVLTTTLIGVIFSIYPATLAANLPPVDALRE